MTTTEYQYNVNYPAKNRTETGLGTVQYEIKHAAGTLEIGAYRYDPNSLILAAHHGVAGFKLGEPSAAYASFLSGEPGYLFRNDVLEVALTGEELVRLAMKNLRQDEFYKLAEHFGVFYEIRDYDDETGTATSPRYTFAEQEAHTEQSKYPQLFVVKDVDGNWRPHSIMNFHTADEIRIDQAARDGVAARVVCMDEPKNAWIPDPFDNVVALYIGENDTMRAYGRFKNEDEARQYRPAAGGVGPNPKIIVASVNATYTR